MNRSRSRESWLAGFRRLVLASSALMALPSAAWARQYTWNGPGTSLNDGANWSDGVPPTDLDTAIFRGVTPSAPLMPQLLQTVTWDQIAFVPGAPSYTLTLPGTGLVLQGGFFNSSGVTQNIVLQGSSGSPAQVLVNNGTLGDLIFRGIGDPAFNRVELAQVATGGTARIENAALALGSRASADRLTLVDGSLILAGTATLANASITLAPGSYSVAENSSSFGAARVTIRDGARLDLRDSTDGGTSTIIVLGQGSLDARSMSAATFTFGRLEGDGRVVMGTRSGFGLVINGPGGTFAGSFEGGTGALDNSVTFATGAYTLTGTSPYRGRYAVSNGASLFVDGNIGAGAQLDVGAGTLVGGNGTLPTTITLGTISPGRGGIGTLSVNGTLALATSSITAIEVDPATSTNDRINVTGTVQLLQGATLQVTSLNGALPTPGQTFTVIQAGLVDNTFSNVTDNLVFFDFTTVYTGTQVNLVATQLPFSSPTVTNNVRNLATQGAALDTYVVATGGPTAPASAPPGTPVPPGAQARVFDFDTVLLELLRIPTAGQATAALHSLSGEAYASFTTVGLEQLDRFRYAALDAAGSCEGRGGEMRGRYCAWADAYYVSATLNGEGDLAGFDYTLSGVQGGVEMRVQPDAVVGFTLGYGEQRMRNFDFASRRITGDALFAGVYGTYGVGPWQAVGLLGYTRFDVDGERDIVVGSIGRQARSNFGADGMNAAAALRYRASFGSVRVEPEVLLAYSQYWQDGFTETGADSLNLRVNGTDANSFVTGIGVRVATEFAVEGRMVRPFAVLRYEHDWLAGTDEDHRVTASFAAVPEAGSWTVFGQNRGQENLIGRLGVIGEIASNVALFGTVGGQLNTNGSEWGVGGGVRVTF